MIVHGYHGVWPQVASTARAGEDVTLTGSVILGENVNLWYGTVIRGDVGPIEIGEGTNIQDNSTVHCKGGVPTRIGRYVTVGHNAVLHSCDVGDHCLIGMGAILLNYTVVGEGSVVAAGALVPEGMVIPPNSVVMGVPAKVVRQVTEEERKLFQGQNQHYLELAQEELPSILSQMPDLRYKRPPSDAY